MQVTSTDVLLAAPPTTAAGLTYYGVSLPVVVMWLNFIYIVIVLGRLLWKMYKERKNE